MVICNTTVAICIFTADILSMKKYTWALVACALLAGVVFFAFTGCSKNKCGGNTCQNGAPCTGNVCVCPAGYWGASCEFGWTDKAVGTYSCTRSGCAPGLPDIGTWQSVVAKSGTNGGYTLQVSNFDKSGYSVSATIDSAGNILIAPGSSTYGISASGNYNNGKITLVYTTHSSGTKLYSCTMNMTKQ